MTDEPNTPRPDPAGNPHGDAAAPREAQPEQQNMEQLISGAAKLAEKVTTLEGQIADLTDRLLRAHAEMDNLRKRGIKDKEDTAKYAIQKFASDVVNVADNFERAITSVPAGAAEQNAAFKSLLDGVSITEREFLNVLERHGVRRIAPQGQPFNPHQHQAVMEAQDPSVAPGTIVQVYQNGYVIEDRVLRPAMVVVAKGGSKSQDSKMEKLKELLDLGPLPLTFSFDTVLDLTGLDLDDDRAKVALGKWASSRGLTARQNNKSVIFDSLEKGDASPIEQDIIL